MGEVPVPVTEYLAAVTDRVVEVFGAEVTGVYTTGSLALGGFHPGRSDIDLMAVVEGSADRIRLRALAGRLDHAALPCPAPGLEFVLYPLATVRTATLRAGYLMNLNTGPQRPPLVGFDPDEGPSFWYVVDRAVTYQSGRPLLGPPPREVFAPMPVAHLLPVVIDSVQAQAEARPQATDLLDNAVLNACRALRFATDHAWYTKQEAGQRTLPAAGAFGPLIRRAITTVEQPCQAGSDLPADVVHAFLADVLVRLRDIADRL